MLAPRWLPSALGPLSSRWLHPASFPVYTVPFRVFQPLLPLQSQKASARGSNCPHFWVCSWRFWGVRIPLRPLQAEWWRKGQHSHLERVSLAGEPGGDFRVSFRERGDRAGLALRQHTCISIAPSESTVKRIKSHGDKRSKSIFYFLCVVTVILFPLSIFLQKTCINDRMTEQLHLILNLTLFLHAFKLPWTPMPYPMKQPNLCATLLGCEIFSQWKNGGEQGVQPSISGREQAN